MEQIRESVSETVEKTKEFGESVGKSVSDLASNAQEGIKNTYDNVVSSIPTTAELSAQASAAEQSTAEGVSSFFSANTLISKIAFVFFIIILFLILMKIGIMLIGYFTGKPADPFIVKGNISATTNLSISRNPELPTSVVLPRSNNEKDGAEFTWSVWLNVNSLTNTQNNDGVNSYYNHVFNVGNSVADTRTGIMTINNAPGLYLTEYKNVDYNPNGKGYGLKLHVIMDTEPVQAEGNSESTNKTLDITELPFNNWFHVAVRMKNTVMDVYINGTIAGRMHFQTVPKQNYYDIHVCNNGGFNGYLSNLRYYSRALNVFDINSVVLAGPDLSSAVISGNKAGSTTLLNNYGYISNTWYMNKL